MKRILQPVVNFLKREDGPTAVECALMLGLVIVVCLVAIQSAQNPREATALEPVVVETVPAR